MTKEQKLQAAIEVIRKISENSKAPFVPRREVPNITNNLVTAGTLANLDSSGDGIPGAFRIGRQVCYPIDSLCDWLIRRMEA